MKLLVTGSSGFVGDKLICTLIGLGYDVIALSRNKIHFEHIRLRNILIDLRKIGELNIDPDIDAIFHVAARINFDDSSESILAITNDNIIVSYLLADFVIRHNINKVILSSSCSVYEENYCPEKWITEESLLRPQNLYALTKLTCEWIFEAKLRGVINEFVILRYSSIYGPGSRTNSILPTFIQKTLANQTIEIFGLGNRTQDYVYIDDVVQANISTLNVKLPFKTILNIGSGYAVSDKLLAKTIVETWNSKIDIAILNQNNKPETILNYSIEKARKLINFHPLALTEGLISYKKG